MSVRSHHQISLVPANPSEVELHVSSATYRSDLIDSTLTVKYRDEERVVVEAVVSMAEGVDQHHRVVRRVTFGRWLSWRIALGTSNVKEPAFEAGSVVGQE